VDGKEVRRHYSAVKSFRCGPMFPRLTAEILSSFSVRMCGIAGGRAHLAKATVARVRKNGRMIEYEQQDQRAVCHGSRIISTRKVLTIGGIVDVCLAAQKKRKPDGAPGFEIRYYIAESKTESLEDLKKQLRRMTTERCRSDPEVVDNGTIDDDEFWITGRSMARCSPLPEPSVYRPKPSSTGHGLLQACNLQL